jgi:hypothetical protein
MAAERGAEAEAEDQQVTTGGARVAELWICERVLRQLQCGAEPDVRRGKLTVPGDQPAGVSRAHAREREERVMTTPFRFGASMPDAVRQRTRR